MHKLITSFALLTAACSSGGDFDPEVLFGTWTECDASGDATFTFGEDGSYLFSEDGGDDRLEGTYEADATTLFVDGVSADGSSVEMEYTYYANADVFVFGAGHPEGDHDGPVGTWVGRLRVDDGVDVVGAASTMTLAADNTGTIEQVPFDGSETFTADGTWGPDPDASGGFELEVEADGFTVSISFEIVDDAALGSPRFCRQ
jgi:hypothetical protein